MNGDGGKYRCSAGDVDEVKGALSRQEFVGVQPLEKDQGGRWWNARREPLVGRWMCRLVRVSYPTSGFGTKTGAVADEANVHRTGQGA